MLSEVPEDWSESKLEDVCEILDKFRVPLNSDERQVRKGSVPYWGANGIVDYIDEAIFDEPLLLMPEDGGPFGEARVKPICHKIDEPVWVNNHAHVLRVTGANREYVYQWFVNRDITDFLVGGTRAKLNQKALRTLPVFLPPLNEQHRIAEILSSVDASIQATQAVIEQAERVKRGLMEELLTGGLGSEAIERGEVPEGWALSSVSSVLKPSLFIDGDWGESKDQSPDGDVRLIQLADIGDGYFIDKSDRHLTKDTAMRLKCTFLRKGDILVARMPEPLGRCCFFPLEGEECFVTVVDVAIMRPHNSFNAMWLMNLINSDYARRFIEDNAGGTTRKRISRKNLGGLLLPVPPISEQCRIAEILSDSDNFIAKQKKTVEQLTRTKRGLMDDLLTGKVRTV